MVERRRRLTILLSEIEQRIAFAVTMTIGTDHLRVGWDLPGRSRPSPKRRSRERLRQ